MNKRKGSTKRKLNPLLIAGGLGLGAYFILNGKTAEAQEMPPAGIGSGYGGGAILGTQGSATTSAPVSSTGESPVYNITFSAPTFESMGGTDTTTTKKEQTTAETKTFSTVGQKSSINVGGYTGTSTVLSTSGNKLLDFGTNAQAVTLTKKQVAQESIKQGGAPVVALAPVGNTVSDVVKAGNVASIIAQSTRNDPRLATPPPAPPKKTSTPVNTGWGNPIGMISSWFGWR